MKDEGLKIINHKHYDVYNAEDYDRLNDIFDKQKLFQELVGNFPITNEKQKQEFINSQSLALFVEMSETLMNTKFKAWKKNQEFNSKEYKKEIIDCWHFLINLTLVEMEADEFYNLFCEKNNINIERQKNGY